MTVDDCRYYEKKKRETRLNLVIYAAYNVTYVLVKEK